ncbi:MAG: DUF6504 family protein [Armatimonadota bacterium]
MTKTVDEPVVMLGAERGWPGHTFIWRDQEHEILTVGGHWARRGRWWIGEGCRYYFRITTLSNLSVDLCYDSAAHGWTLAEIWD